jgi:hypothetical protein
MTYKKYNGDINVYIDFKILKIKVPICHAA